MLKQLTSLLILGTILFVFYYEFLETPFLNGAELNTTREKAVHLANNGELEKSIEIFEALIDVAPNDKKIWGDYLLITLRSKGEQQALSLLREKPLDLIPQYAFKELFDAAIYQGDELLAFQLAQQELRVSEDISDIALLRSQVLEENGYPLYAYELLEIALNTNYDIDDDLVLAKIRLIIKSDEELAQNEVKKFIDQGSKNEELWKIYVDYWIAQARQGNLKQSISSLADYVGKAPEEIQLSYDYMVLLTWDENFTEAEKIYNQLQEKEKMPDYARSAAAQTLYRNGRVEESEKLYRKLYEEEPENIEYRKGLAKSLVELNMPDEALALLQPISRSVDNDVRIIIGLAQQASGKDTQALDSLSRALNSEKKEDQKAYAAWMQSFRNVLSRQSFDSLWSRYSVPLQTAPSDVVRFVNDEKNRFKKIAKSSKKHSTISYKALAKLQAATARQQGRSLDAISLYRKALRVSPDDRELTLGLALSYIDYELYDDARRLLDDLLQRYPAEKEVHDAFVYFAQQADDGRLLAKHLRILAENTHGAEQDGYLSSWVNVILNHQDFATSTDRLAELNKMTIGSHPQISMTEARVYFTQNQCDKVVSILSSVPIQQWKQSQLSQAAYYFRSCEYHNEALVLYENGMRRYPNSSEFFAGAMLVATQNKSPDYNEKIISCCANKFSGDVDFLLAHAYFNQSQSNYSDALLIYERILAIDPDNREAYVSRTFMLAYLNQTEQAFIEAESNPSWFSDEEWAMLHELRVKFALTQAVNSDYYARDTFAEQAILYIDEQIVFLNHKLPGDDQRYIHAMLNKVHALNLANMPKKSVYVFESIIQSDAEIPLWGKVHAAQAYENIKQPAEAVRLLEPYAESDSGDLHMLSVLFSSYLALEDYDHASQVLNSMNEKVVEGHDDKSRVHWVTRLTAMFEAYQNKLRVAEKELLNLQEQAPDDLNVLSNLATIYRWRGLPNKSAQTLAKIDKHRVDEIEYAVSEANINLDLKKYPLAEKQVVALSADAPKHNSVKQLQQRWELHNSYQYLANFQYGESSGNTFGNKDFTFDQRLYSKPIQHHYRVYFRDRYDWAEFPEDNGNLHRIGIGGEFRNQDYDISAELNASVRDDSDIGIFVNGLWRLGDHWRLFGDVQTYSHHVPLRAINAGIDGESVSAGFQYRWDDSRYFRASASYADFSDGNKRKSFFLQHQHDVYQSAHHQLYLSEEFYASDNTEDDVGYFNPEQDYSFRVAAKYYGILWRRYEKSYVHRLTVGVGNYKQKNHSNAGIWDIEYQHQWTPDPSMEIKYGVLHRRRTYDGDAESYNAITGSINWRF